MMCGWVLGEGGRRKGREGKGGWKVMKRKRKK